MRPSFLLRPHNLSYNDLNSILISCTKSKSSKQTKQIHAMLITSSGYQESLAALQSKLVGVYASSDDLRYARKLFDEMPDPNVFAFNWMISAMAFHGQYQDSIGYFSLMGAMEKRPNEYTLSSVLKGCAGLLDLILGMGVHQMVHKLGFECHVVVCNALVDMYCKCGEMDSAQRVFDAMPDRNVVSWTSIISGYCHVGKVGDCIDLFERMKFVGLEPNDYTWNAIIGGYAQSGDCEGALTLFSRMVREGLVPDMVTRNALISGFARGGRPVEAVKLFRDMLFGGIRPNNVTVTGLLPAYGLLESIHGGSQIHALICKLGLETDLYVASALVNMYLKCGSVRGAEIVFEGTSVKNVVLWNSMIGCFSRHGLFDSSIQLFERMIKEGFKANEVTLLSVLSACSHGGFVETGMKILGFMEDRYPVTASKEHIACIVDLLSRAGKIEEAYELLKQIKVEMTESMAGAFFNGCKIRGRSDMAELLRHDLLKVDSKKPGGFVMLANIYAAHGEWNKVSNVRKLMKENDGIKKPGSSIVAIGNENGFKELVPGS